MSEPAIFLNFRMKQHITYSDMCKEAVGIAEKLNINPIGDFSRIAVLGMGGSGVAGDLLKDLMKYDSEKDIEIVKDYILPKNIDSNTLVFCISYSGDTEETLSQFLQATKRGCQIISITSGGRLKQWSEKKNIPVITLPSGYQPRDALPYMFLPIVVVLKKLGIADYSEDIKEAMNVANKIDTKIMEDVASGCRNCNIAIYGPANYSGIVARFKNEFNENSKMLVYSGCVPEMHHNEINGYQRMGKDSNIKVILLRDKDESVETRERFEITKKIDAEHSSGIYEIWATGKSKLAKIMSYSYIASYITARISELDGINREKVEIIQTLKKELKERLNLAEKLEKSL